MKRLLTGLLFTGMLLAKGHGHTGHYSLHSSHPRIHRSAAAKNQFQRQHPCPSTGATSGGCKGYVIDHKKALACGGADAPSNMQWQTTEASKAKDRWERRGCK